MNTKHANMRVTANFLSTKTGPKLVCLCFPVVLRTVTESTLQYYKPWELLPEQEDRIKQQISNTGIKIEDEKQLFYEKHEHLKPTSQEAKQDQERMTDMDLVGDANTKDRQQSQPVSSVNDIDVTNSPPPIKRSSSKSPSNNRKAPVQNDENNGDVLVENDEDAVIY